MPDIKDIHTFTGGMNLDADARNVKSDQTREAWNCRYDDATGSNAGSTVNLLGNSYIFNRFIDTDVISGSVIGSCFDQKRNSVIYFVNHNTTFGDISGIYSVDVDTDDIKVILRDNLYSVPWTADKLDFNALYRINDAKVIGDMLYWNTTHERPGKINIEKALAAGTSDGYLNISNAEISAIKFPSLYPPTGYIFTDTNVIFNNIRGNTFLFKYRYVYDDFERSVCSPESKVITSVDQYAFNGNVIDSTLGNAISIALWSGTCSVSHVELLCRIGQTGDWFIVKTFDKVKEHIGDWTLIVYTFRNDSARIAVDQDYVNRPYDYLPDLADSMEFIDNKYMAYAGTTEGFDNIETNIILTPQVDQLPRLDINLNSKILFDPNIGASTITSQTYTFKNVVVNGAPRYRSGYIISVDPGLLGNYNPVTGTGGILTSDDTYSIRIIRRLQSNSWTPLDVTGKDQIQSAYLTPLAFTQKLMYFVNQGFNSTAYATKVNPNFTDGTLLSDEQFAILPIGWYNDDWDDTVSLEIWITFYNGIGQSKKMIGGIKSGASHLFGLEYVMDDGKLTTVQGENLSVYVPFQTESLYKAFPSYRGVMRHNVKWEIFHLPPVGSVAYHWVYGGRANIGSFKQYLIGGKSSDQAIFNYIEDGGNTYTCINLSFLNELTVDQATIPVVSPDVQNVDFPISSTSLSAYIFQKGDRIRFLTQLIDPFNVVWANSVNPIGMYVGLDTEKYLEFEIIGYRQDENSENTDIIKVQLFDWTHYWIGRGSLVEIYTPKDNLQEVIYREIGETYPILTSNGVRYHGGQISNQNASVAASGIFGTVDICHVLRAFPYKTNVAVSGVVPPEIAGEKLFWCESDSYSDFFPSTVLQLTRANFYDPTASRKYQYIIRRSNAFFEDTKTNGLSTFEYDKYVTLSSRHGKITSIREIGYTLKVLQENKQTSIYIGRNGLKQAVDNGVDIVVASDNVFNVANPSEFDFGCKNLESVVVVDRNLYFYDKIRKCIVADDPNGPSSISDNSVSSFLESEDGTQVIAGYDQKYKEVYFLFPVSGTTIMYSHIYKNWKAFVNFVDANGRTPECFGWGGKSIFSFIGGFLWKHNSTKVSRNNFYGKQWNTSIRFVSNMNPLVVKVFNSIAINSNKKFSSPEYTDITSPFTSTSKLGIQSKLMSASFIPREGVWYAPYNCNALTHTSIPTLSDLVSGIPIRAQWIEQNLVNEDTTEVILNNVIVHCTHSPVSG
jgi:hypothetical protein